LSETQQSLLNSEVLSQTMEESHLVIGISPKPKSSLQNPIATLYLKKVAIGPKVINTIVHIKNLLQLKGIFEDEIEEILLQDGDERLAGVIEKAGKDEFPLIFVQDVCIGVRQVLHLCRLLTLFTDRE
jgi:hypothetical protein